ncbi:hypothetical protein INR49_022733 [Caranx melampygus]|nr:hypothetical protein INR49_022733 [Caranx melampygus]
MDGADWISDTKNGVTSVKAVTLVELRSRSDTGKPNTSPQTDILPTLRVPSNCQRDFSLLTFDPDGDKLVMEDFPKQNITLTQTDGSQEVKTPNDAISKIPVQFVLRVDPAVPSCTEGLYLPRFLPPTPANGARLFTPVNQPLEISIKAEANISMVSELVFSGPHNMLQTAPGGGHFTLRWTPSEAENGESHAVCFLIQEDDKTNNNNNSNHCSNHNTHTKTTQTTTITQATTTISNKHHYTSSNNQRHRHHYSYNLYNSYITDHDA